MYKLCVTFPVFELYNINLFGESFSSRFVGALENHKDLTCMLTFFFHFSLKKKIAVREGCLPPTRSRDTFALGFKQSDWKELQLYWSPMCTTEKCKTRMSVLFFCNLMNFFFPSERLSMTLQWLESKYTFPIFLNMMRNVIHIYKRIKNSLMSVHVPRTHLP